MWLDWIVAQYTTRALTRQQPEKINVIIRTAAEREFAPFSIEWRDSTLILCENTEPDPDTELTVREDGEANFYSLVHRKNWFARVQFNGELSTAQQEAFIKAVAAIGHDDWRPDRA